MLRGWRYLGHIAGVFMYQQNRRYVGMILGQSEQPPASLGPGIYSPRIVELDFEAIEPQVPAPYAPYDSWALIRVLGLSLELLPVPRWATVSWYPYSLTSVVIPTPEEVIVHMPVGDELLAYIISAPQICTVLFEVILAPASIPLAPASVTGSLEELDTIYKLPRISSPDRITVMLSEVTTEPVVTEYSDYPIIDAQYDINIEGKGVRF